MDYLTCCYAYPHTGSASSQEETPHYTVRTGSTESKQTIELVSLNSFPQGEQIGYKVTRANVQRWQKASAVINRLFEAAVAGALERNDDKIKNALESLEKRLEELCLVAKKITDDRFRSIEPFVLVNQFVVRNLLCKEGKAGERADLLQNITDQTIRAVISKVRITGSNKKNMSERVLETPWVQLRILEASSVARLSVRTPQIIIKTELHEHELR